MKIQEIGKRVKHVSEYVIGGIEREMLLAKFNELCEARARVAALEAEINNALNKYEGI